MSAHVFGVYDFMIYLLKYLSNLNHPPWDTTANMSDYILTIDSDTEDDTLKNDPIDDVKLDPDFVFDPAGDPYSEIINKSLGIEDFVKTGSKPVRHFLTLQFCKIIIIF